MLFSCRQDELKERRNAATPLQWGKCNDYQGMPQYTFVWMSIRYHKWMSECLASVLKKGKDVEDEDQNKMDHQNSYMENIIKWKCILVASTSNKSVNKGDTIWIKNIKHMPIFRNG